MVLLTGPHTFDYLKTGQVRYSDLQCSNGFPLCICNYDLNVVNSMNEFIPVIQAAISCLISDPKIEVGGSVEVVV